RDRDDVLARDAQRREGGAKEGWLGALDGDEGARLRALAGGDGRLEPDRARGADERHLVGRGGEVRAAVEGIDAPRVPEADAAEHLLDAPRLRAHLADDVLGVLRKERRVDR